jgi:adenosylhomocysteine nucleosidase
LAFVAAERIEFDGVLRRAERVEKLDWPLRFARAAWLKGEPIVLVADGPGPQSAGRAAEAVGKLKELRGLISTGFCGALNPELKACDIFVATEIAGVAHALSAPRSDSCEHYKIGKLLSIDRVVSSVAEKADLRRTGADAVEMEAAAVAAKAAEWNIPFYCIRVVTDTATEGFSLDFNRMRDTNGRFSRAKILASALRRPASVLPELLRINRRCKDASRKLGDFLVDASF